MNTELELAVVSQTEIDEINQLHHEIISAASHAEIPLTQGKVMLVDIEDYPLLSRWKWCALCASGGHWTACRNYVNPLTKKRSLIYAHRQILNAPDGMVVDHINGGAFHTRGQAMEHESTLRTKFAQHRIEPPAFANPRSKKYFAPDTEIQL